MLRKATLAWILATLPVTAIAMYSDVLLKGLDSSKPVALVVDGVERPLGVVGADGNISVPLDATLDAALDPNKNYVVYKNSCNRYAIYIQGSDDEKRCRQENEDAKSEDACGRCVPVGFILKGQFRSLSSAAQQAAVSTATGFSVGVFGFGSGKMTHISNADTAVPVIDDRATAANYNRPRDISVDEKASGGGWGGGVNLAFGNFPVGFRATVAHEQERDSPTQRVDIQRDAGGLRFQQFGDSRIGSTMLSFGPTVHIPGGIVLTGGPTVSWWNLELSQTGSLRVGCPNPCTTVRTDDVREEIDGTDIGVHVGAEFYPGNSWYGFYFSFVQMTYENAYDPTRALAWPRDWKDRNIFVGAVLRSNGGRPRLLFR